jgi:hypothetical protein
MSFNQVHDGDSIPLLKGQLNYIQCCDCGLVHKLRVYVRGKRVYAQVWRDHKLTNQVRKTRKK